MSMKINKRDCLQKPNMVKNVLFKGNLNSKHPGVRVDGDWSSCEDERKIEDISSKTDEEAN